MVNPALSKICEDFVIDLYHIIRLRHKKKALSMRTPGRDYQSCAHRDFLNSAGYILSRGKVGQGERSSRLFINFSDSARPRYLSQSNA
jgi:hypothetical protein